MIEDRPEALLKSALEKIIYFEARSEQLANDLGAARAEADRLRGELSQAAQREIELRRQMAEHEVQIRRGHLNREELANVIDALKAERAELIGKLIEASRIHSSGVEEDAPFDLASFIAQLRSEALASKPHHEQPPPARREIPPPSSRPAISRPPASYSVPASQRPISQTNPGFFNGSSPTVPPQPSAILHEGRPPFASAKASVPMRTEPLRSPEILVSPAAPVAVLVAHEPPPPVVEEPLEMSESSAAAVSAHAERLLSEGRLSVSAQQLEELTQKTPVVGRSEETLFGFSVRELSSPDVQARLRAAERLKVLGQPAAAAPLASALMTERDPQVLVALLGAFSVLAFREGATVVARHLEAPVAEVRISALKAMLVLDPAQAAPYLSAAMKDPEPSVRRRASLLALGLSPDSALALGQQAMVDSSSEVRRLGALALGATAGEKARELLIEAVNDADAKVRKVAAQSLSRILGRDVSSLVNLDGAQRRREVRKLMAPPSTPLPPLPQMPAEALAPPEFSEKVERHVEREEPLRAQVMVSEAAMAPAVEEPLCASLMSEVRCAIRGRTASELCGVTQKALQSVESACELLVARGQLVRRGKKYFAA